MQSYTHCARLPKSGLVGALRVIDAIGHQRKNLSMRTFTRLVPLPGLAALLLAGCAYRDHDRTGVSVRHGGYWLL